VGGTVTTRVRLRIPGAVRVVACLPVSVTDDVDAVRAAAGHLLLYGQLPSHRAMLDREGFAGPEDAALIGDEATVSERIAELRSAGVDEFGGYVFDLSAEDGARTRALLSTVGVRHHGRTSLRSAVASSTSSTRMPGFRLARSSRFVRGSITAADV
jgi:alkanesulfonate monooxygenase SsuD/methylene tetrahydromethanopterin reductase-like flavin-dependent oxidoreductase (luciferase family)